MALLLVGIGIGLFIGGGIALVRAVRSGGREGLGNHEPLRVAVDRNRPDAWSVAFYDDAPRCPPRADLAAQPPAAIYATLREHGGIDFGATELRLNLRTHGEAEVVVREISVVVVGRDPAFAGRLMGIGTPANRPPGALVFDLDDEDEGHTVHAVSPVEPITVRSDAPVDVIVVGTTPSAHCQWRVHLDTEIGAERHRMTVGDRDLPFETTGGDPSAFPHGLERLD